MTEVEDRELEIEDAHHLFVGKTIAKMDSHFANQIELMFTDGTKVALHIDCGFNGLPLIRACTHCTTIEA